MPTPKPLTPTQAKKTLAAKFGPKIDRIRQLATKLGVRPYRVFLVWEQSSGSERGSGVETEVQRIEILPTPKVDSLDAVMMDPRFAGSLPVGSIRVSRVSSSFTEDLLRGKRDHRSIPDDISFFYEVVEDGRGDDLPVRMKYRLASTPVRRAGKVDWLLILERISEDNSRTGQSQLGDDSEF